MVSLGAASIRLLNLTLVPDKPRETLGHCVVPELNASNADTEESRELMVQILDCVLQKFGPFST